MSPSVLGLGIPHTSNLVPDGMRDELEKLLEKMNSDMDASPYDWEKFWITPDMDFDLLIEKLREKKWDIVVVGAGLRTINSITPFFESIINAVHKELPDAKFAFNADINSTEDACRRVYPV